MSGLACELADRQWWISGVDRRRYEPVASQLEQHGVRLIADTEPLPDGIGLLLISGGGCANHPHLLAARERGITVSSFASFLGERFLSKTRNLVVGGTNGKTTTTAMLVWILDCQGVESNYLIGGQLAGNDRSVRLVDAPISVLEGDEYPADTIQLESKFCSYRPAVVSLSNIHYDHPEIFADEAAYEKTFERLIASLPEDGAVIYNADDPAAERIAAGAEDRVGVGFSGSAAMRLSNLTLSPGGTRFSLSGVDVCLPAIAGGEMNARNAAVAIAMAERVGVDRPAAAAALADFPGVAERQEVVYEGAGGILIIDEGYHPDALRPLFASLKARFPGRQLLPVFRARCHGGRRGYHQRRLPAAFDGIARAVVCNAVSADEALAETDQFDNAQFHRDLAAVGCEVFPAETIHDVLAATEIAVRPGDVVVCLFGFGKPNLRASLEGIVAGLG
jgi:UDP-N-acetylmuramate: L-alanyl-gamma-D-glutamyl-meso-diaminopimelate ligase